LSVSVDSLLFPVLRLLDDGCICSGKVLAQRLSTTETYITKVIANARAIGLDIQGISEHSYCWLEPIIWLDSHTIRRNITPFAHFYSIETINSLPSTNTYLLDHFLENDSDNNKIPVLAVEMQTDGRGRQGRTWHSGIGENLLFSLAWHFKKHTPLFSGLSLVIGVAIVRSLRTLNINDITLKWPNDILFNEKKIAGVLIETTSKALDSQSVVIGIGLNVKLSDFTRSSIDSGSADIFSITGRLIDRNILLAVLLVEIHEIMFDFERFGFSYFKNEWMAYHAFSEKPVILTLPGGLAYEGVIDDLNDDGSIILDTLKKKLCFNIGEISLRLK